jgi:hypothetical protein
MLYKNVTVILIERSTANNPDQSSSGQTVDITHEPDTVRTSVDGVTSRGHHPSTVIWFAHTAKELERITHVKIVGSDGKDLIDGQTYTTSQNIHNVAEGVQFEVLADDS